MKLAVIENNKVNNIIEFVGDPVTLHLPLGQLTWDCGTYAVAIGDDFLDGVFSREGLALEAQQTDAQKIEALNTQISDLQFALTEVYEKVTV